MDLNVTDIAASKTDRAPKRPLLICLVLIVAAWVLVFWQGLVTAIDLWLISDTFNHCFFILPGSFFFIYLKRDELDLNCLKPNYFILFFSTGSLILYAIGLAGNVQLFMHAATFAFLPLTIWAFIGNKLALKILFPLVFMLFCIPIGEELIPALQKVTADLSMFMLNWSGIPVHRNGLYIEIPQGLFLVAQACSGISFFIASIVIGSVYAYLNIQSVKRRIIFVSISVFFPIIANAIRVFGTIMTGYLTDMEHAVGADHLVYGWIFFSLVIVCLLAIGELMGEKQLFDKKLQNETASSAKLSVKSCYQSTISIVALMFIFLVWFNLINGQLNQSQNTPRANNNLSALLEVEQNLSSEIYTSTWKPEFNQPFQEWQFIKDLNGVTVDVYMVWYPSGHGELINSLNKLYAEKAWTLKSASRFKLNDGKNMNLSVIVNPQDRRLLSYWYVIDGQLFTNKLKAKFYQIYKILMGSHIGSGLVAISQTTDNVSPQKYTASFAVLIQDNINVLSQYFDFK